MVMLAYKVEYDIFINISEISVKGSSWTIYTLSDGSRYFRFGSAIFMYILYNY